MHMYIYIDIYNVTHLCCIHDFLYKKHIDGLQYLYMLSFDLLK